MSIAAAPPVAMSQTHPRAGFGVSAEVACHTDGENGMRYDLVTHLWTCQKNEGEVDRLPPDGIELPPVAPMLMQSLRAVGYSPRAAIADLVDNSVAAGASHVAIMFAGVPEPWVAVVDDGCGMDEKTLLSAMRFGSRDPRDVNSGVDLGRFGLGLKTASLSHCRRLTVASLRNSVLSVAAWDLDECEARRSWWLSRPSASSLPEDAMDRLRGYGRGTAVVWQNLDRLGISPGQDQMRELDRSMADVSDHLGMVFHRFLAGEMAVPLKITVNNRAVPDLDPFLEGHERGQALHGETFPIEGHQVSVSPFVLPFPSRLKPAELERAGGRESLKTGHGFYVYRGGRLVVPGGWFRIVPSDELIRLARVRVDVPVALDHLWKVDIRKTIAEPPPALRPELKRIVGEVTRRSRRVYAYKGTPSPDADRVSLWSREDGRDGAASWKINRDHPIVVAAIAKGGADQSLEHMLTLLEDLLPLHEIHLHISNDLPVAEHSKRAVRELELMASRMADAFADTAELRTRLLDRLPFTEPFSSDPELARRIAEALR